MSPDRANSSHIKNLSKGQNEVPSQIRREFDLKDGDVIVWIKTAEGYIVDRQAQALV